MPPARWSSSTRCSPDGRTFASSGVRCESSWKRSSVSGTPTRPASASRWTTAFVAAADRHQHGDRVVERLGREDPGGRRALARELDGAGARCLGRANAGRRRRPESTPCRAGTSRAPRPATPSSTPSPSRCSGRSRAWPPPRARRTRPRSSGPRAARRRSATGRCPRRAAGRGTRPACDGPPVIMIAGTSALAAPISCAGIVLSQPPSSTTASSG